MGQRPRSHRFAGRLELSLHQQGAAVLLSNGEGVVVDVDRSAELFESVEHVAQHAREHLVEIQARHVDERTPVGQVLLLQLDPGHPEQQLVVVQLVEPRVEALVGEQQEHGVPIGHGERLRRQLQAGRQQLLYVLARQGQGDHPRIEDTPRLGGGPDGGTDPFLGNAGQVGDPHQQLDVSRIGQLTSVALEPGSLFLAHLEHLGSAGILRTPGPTTANSAPIQPRFRRVDCRLTTD